MADAGSALEAQQQIAAGIPYKNIALENPIQKMLGAAYITSEMSRRKLQLENAFQMQALKMEGMQQKMELDRDRFGQAQERMQWDKDKFYQNAEINRVLHEDQMARGWAAIKNAQDLGEIRRERENRFAEKQIDAAEGASGALSAISNMESAPGTPPYEPELLKVTSPFAAKNPAAVTQIVSNFLNRSNSTRDHNQRAIEAEEKRLNDDVGRILGGGNTLEQNLQWILHPESLQDATAGGWFGTSLGATKTGKKTITNSAGVSQDVDLSDIKDLQRRYLDIQQARGNLAAPINRPDIGVYSHGPDPSMEEKAKRVLMDINSSDVAKAAAHKILGY
jgi:hypothetical protein